MIENSVGASAWSNLYMQAANADHMRQLAVRKEDPNYEAIALTLRTLFLQNIADLFGDAPYSQAFKGSSEGIKQPVFDSQEAVYRALLADLEHANSLYDSSLKLPSAERDLLYKGDISKWRKFNNSLYLRLLMRLSNRNAAMALPRRSPKSSIIRTGIRFLQATATMPKCLMKAWSLSSTTGARS